MKEPLRTILHIFPSLDVGGTEMKASLVINGSADRYRHVVAVLGGGMLAKSLFIKSDNVVFEDLREKTPSTAIAKILFARKLIRDHAPDLTVSYGWGASDAVLGNMLLPGTPHIHTEEGFFDEMPDHQKWIRRMIRIVSFGRVTFLCVPSESLRAVASKSWHIPANKIKYVPNGVDVQKFNAAGNRKKTSTPVVVTILASLSPVKNHERMFRVFAAASRDADMALVVAGAGGDRGRLEAYAVSLGIRDKVTMTGYVSDPAAILAATDVFCLSSDSEQMPMTVLEAMASSLPVVATDVGDIQLVVSEENKPYIVDAGNEPLFARKLVEMAKNESLRTSVGNKNREKCAASYDRQKMVNRMIELYDTAIATRAR
jgi:glycosyltransferase involved in cell wall biosynthesis